MLEKILEDRSAEIEIDAVCGDIMNKKIRFILMVAVMIAIISSPNALGRIMKKIRMAAGRGINAILSNKWTVCASVLLVAIVHIAVMADDHRMFL